MRFIYSIKKIETFLIHNIFQSNIVKRAKGYVETEPFNEFRQVEEIHKMHYLY